MTATQIPVRLTSSLHVVLLLLLNRLFLLFYRDIVMKYIRSKNNNLSGQLKTLTCLYEDVHCRYSLATSKLTAMLDTYLDGSFSNVSHMAAYLNEFRQIRGEIPASHSTTTPVDMDRNRILAAYEECMMYQHQLNIVQNVIRRIQAAQATASSSTTTVTEKSSRDAASTAAPASTSQQPAASSATAAEVNHLRAASSDKLRVLSECLLDVLLHYVTEYKSQAINSMYPFFDRATCERMFDALVVGGEAHHQLTVCALLVQMCAGQSWWGQFMASTFTRLYSAQNTDIFPPDRIFYLMSYLARKSMGATLNRTTNVIDEILRGLAEELVPLAQRRIDERSDAPFGATDNDGPQHRNADHQLISWLLLFLSVCLDDSNAAGNIVPDVRATEAGSGSGAKAVDGITSGAGTDKRNGSSGSSGATGARWEFMSGDADLVKARATAVNSSGGSNRHFSRSFKKRMLQSKSSNLGAATEKDASVQVAQLTSQIEAALKQQEHLMKKHQVKLQHLQSCLDKTKKQISGSNNNGIGGSSSNTMSSNSSSNNSSGASSAETIIAPEAAQAAATVVTSAVGDSGGSNEHVLTFERNVRTMKISNTVVVIRGLIGLLLCMDYTCNMDMFLLTCKVPECGQDIYLSIFHLVNSR